MSIYVTDDGAERDFQDSLKVEPVKCVGCGRFISYDDMTNGAASFYFEPDNHFGPERSEWTCKECK